MEFNRQGLSQTQESVQKLTMKMQFQKTYATCTKKCITDYKYKDLADVEKKCLVKCYESFNEGNSIAQQLLSSYLVEYEKKKEAEAHN